MPAIILIPCKTLRDGKSRLSACLDHAARHDLCRSLLERTLRCAASVVRSDQVRIVSADPEAVAMARQHAVGAIADPGFGLNAALEYARARLRTGMRTDPDLLVLPIDLPFVTPQCIADVLACPGKCVIAPDQHGTGTNLLYLRSLASPAFPFAFGAGSFAAHLARARSHALTVDIVRDWRLAFDLDAPADYERWLSRKREEPLSAASAVGC
ncbi:MAG: 2-phospho-L-lactate guanylyltransferase [Xanthobacteraceae bacterium]